jgi:RNA-binding protein PNO1
LLFHQFFADRHRTRPLAMVVVHPEASTSAPAAATSRHKTPKKKARIPDETSAPEGGDDALMIDAGEIDTSPQDAPAFDPAPASATKNPLKSETRRIPIPPHRMSPLKKDWVNVFGPLTDMLGLQVRMNVQRRAVDIRVRVLRPCPTALSHCYRRRNTRKRLAHYRKGPTSSRRMLLALTSMCVLCVRKRSPYPELFSG